MQASPHLGQRPKIAAGKPQDDRHTTPHCFLLPTLESLSLPARFKGPGVTTRAWSFHEFSSLNLKSSLPASENPNHRCEHLLSPGCLEASSHPHMEELPAPTSTSAPCRTRLYKFFTLLLTASVEEENRENVAVPTHRTGSRLGVRAGAVTNTHTHTHTLRSDSSALTVMAGPPCVTFTRRHAARTGPLPDGISHPGTELQMQGQGMSFARKCWWVTREAGGTRQCQQGQGPLATRL